MVLAILSAPLQGKLGDELEAEVLFNDKICLAVRRQSPWARIRKIDLSDLTDALWIMPPSGAPGAAAVIEAFRVREWSQGLEVIAIGSPHRQDRAMRVAP